MEAATEELPEASGSLARVCKLAGVARLIVIDDEVGQAAMEAGDLIGPIRAALDNGSVTAQEVEAALSIGITIDSVSSETVDEQWPHDIRAWWEDASPNEKDSICERLENAQISVRLGDEWRLDELERWLSGVTSVQLVDPAEWAQKDQSLLSDATQAVKTLVLFDENLSKATDKSLGETGGVTLLSAALSKWSVGSGVVFGILSNRFTIDGEGAEWDSLRQRHLPAGRFIPLSKQRLRIQDQLCHGVQLALINEAAQSLRTAVGDVAKVATDEAILSLGAMTPWDFERMVFESSQREGAWEVDTLLRLAGIVERQERRRRLYAQRGSLDGSIKAIRRVHEVRVPIVPDITPAVRNLQRQELYLGEEDVNGLRLPLALGDIFVKDAAQTRLMLLAPACDLVLRQDGKRAIEAAALVEVKPSSNDREPRSERPEVLYFSEPDDGRTWTLDLKRPVFIDLDVLDLATFRTDGLCAFEQVVDLEAMFAPQVARYERLRPDFEKTVEDLTWMSQRQTGLSDGPDKERWERVRKLAFKAASLGGATTVRANLEGSRLSFGLRRTGRLLEPSSLVLLSAFHDLQARLPLAHDLAQAADVAVVEGHAENTDGQIEGHAENTDGQAAAKSDES